MSPPDADLNHNKLVERIVDQKLSLNIVINLLENNKESVEAQTVLKDIQSLKEIFDQIIIKQSEITAVEDPKTNVTTLKSKSEITITRDIFNRLKKQIDSHQDKVYFINIKYLHYEKKFVCQHHTLHLPFHSLQGRCPVQAVRQEYL